MLLGTSHENSSFLGTPKFGNNTKTDLLTGVMERTHQMIVHYRSLLSDQFNIQLSKSYLFKQVHGGLGVLVEQVVKHQEQPCHNQRHRTLLGLHVCCQLHNGLDTEHHDGPAAPLWEIVENEQQQLEMLHIQIFCVTGESPLQGILLQGAHKPGNRRRSLSNLFSSEIPLQNPFN